MVSDAQLYFNNYGISSIACTIMERILVYIITKINYTNSYTHNLDFTMNVSFENAMYFVDENNGSVEVCLITGTRFAETFDAVIEVVMNEVDNSATSILESPHPSSLMHSHSEISDFICLLSYYR